MSDQPSTGFVDLGLPFPILRVLDELGYETPSPIQANSIPPLLEGQDVLGMAQTGTGKTAAFALPILTRTNPYLKSPQVLVLAPTRELAQQVAEAAKSYSRYLSGINVSAIYGGADYGSQLRELKRGPQWVVGTPGRVMDHLRRKTLKLDDLDTIVLDEADEMLRMGFIEDVEWIMEQTPPQRQVALFSATMPAPIRRVADNYLSAPKIVKIVSKTSTVERIEQSFWMVSGLHKLDALTRILEVEDFDGIIMFVRTKALTVELADHLFALRTTRCEFLLGLCTLLSELGDELITRGCCVPEGEEVVAGVPDTDIDDIADDAEVIDILGQQKLYTACHG